jgi:hypothetical protein
MTWTIGLVKTGLVLRRSCTEQSVLAPSAKGVEEIDIGLARQPNEMLLTVFECGGKLHLYFPKNLLREEKRDDVFGGSHIALILGKD